MSNYTRPSTGDDYRALLLDLEWIRTAHHTEVRKAVHALCWRFDFETVQTIAVDEQARNIILTSTRGVITELNSKIVELNERFEDLRGDYSRSEQFNETRRERSAARRRTAAANRIVATLRIASGVGDRDLHMQERLTRDAAISFAEAIAEHRREVHPDDSSAADEKLWATLNTILLPHGPDGKITAGMLLAQRAARVASSARAS